MHGAGTSGSTRKTMKSDPFVKLYTHVNSKWIKDQNVRAKPKKLSEENTGEIFVTLDLTEHC